MIERNKKIVLTRCVESSPYAITEVGEDLNLAQVHAILSNRKNLDITIDDHIFLTLINEFEFISHQDKIISQKPDIIVFFIRQPSPRLHFTYRWAKALRNKIKNFTNLNTNFILVGDVSVGYSPLLKNGIIDYVIFGDENIICENILHLINDNSNSITEGFVRVKDNKIEISPPVTLINRNILPLPTLYIGNSKHQKDIKYIPKLRASRGCYASCKFCHESIHVFKNNINYHRFLDIPRLEKEIKQVYDLGVREIVFQDSNFLPAKNLGNNWVIDFSNMILKNFPDLSYSFWTRAIDITEERINYLKQTNINHILIGVESLTPNRLKKFSKGVKVSDIKNAISILDKNSIEGKLSFILFEPDMSIDTLKNELYQIERLFFQFPSVQRTPLFAYNLLSPHPDTPMYKKYLQNGLIKEKPSHEIDEHFSHMSKRLIGSNSAIPEFTNFKMATLCEAFRLHQYEYSKKWFSVINHNRSAMQKNNQFFIGLPIRMIKTMLHMVYEAESYQGDSYKELQQILADIVYFSAMDDYSKYLTTDLQFLETPYTIKYAKKWTKIFEIKR